MVQISLNLVLLWKWLSFWKKGKWGKLSEFLKFNGIKLWFGYVWTTVMICGVCICLVDAFEHECIVFGELFEQGKC